MNTNLHLPPSDRLSLRPGAALTLDRPHDGYTRLVVDSGRLWLTQSGDAGDHFLGAGDDLLLCGDGAVVIECEGAESVRLRVWHAAVLSGPQFLASARRGVEAWGAAVSPGATHARASGG